ncbi:MAG: DUF2635 domain-containing protein [Marinomonas foliarum]|uniref:DUF2635 domain-containing protein n=1 Tax=Marinomonas foliarum TaxID=491950 RepID=UPI003F98C607
MSELKKVKVKPKDGLQVRFENGQVMPSAGADVVLTSYYRRRLNDGDLVHVESKKAAATTAAKTGDK